MGQGLQPTNLTRFTALTAVVLLCCRVHAATVIVGSTEEGTIRALAITRGGLVALLSDGQTTTVDLPPGREPSVGCWLPGAGYILFGDSGALLVPDNPGGENVPVAGAPARVRQVAAADGRLLLLHGGVLGSDGLQSAQVDVCRLSPTHGLGMLHRSVKSEANPRFLAVGELDDGAHVLVGVRTRAVFDQVLRIRPWLYRVTAEGLAPAWLGTSFARPFMAAEFADVDARRPGDEVCSLEWAADGGRLITAYTRYGFVMEGVAESCPAALGDTLRTARIGAGEDLIFAWMGDTRGRFVGFGACLPDNGAVGRLEPRVWTASQERPAAWNVIVSADRPEVLVIDARGALLRYPVRDVRPGILPLSRTGHYNESMAAVWAGRGLSGPAGREGMNRGFSS